MKFFFDTNVIITALSERGEIFNPSEELFKKVLGRSQTGIICAKQLTDIYYVLRKYYPEDKRRRFIQLLIDSFIVLGDEPLFYKKAVNSNIKDYEDAVIDEVITTIKDAYLITENKEDFENSKNFVLTPKQAIDLINVGL